MIFNVILAILSTNLIILFISRAISLFNDLKNEQNYLENRSILINSIEQIKDIIDDKNSATIKSKLSKHLKKIASVKVVRSSDFIALEELITNAETLDLLDIPQDDKEVIRTKVRPYVKMKSNVFFLEKVFLAGTLLHVVICLIYLCLVYIV